MLWGTPPSYRTLVKIARNLAFKPDEVRELFDAAGYALPEVDSAPASGLERFLELAAELEARYNRPALTIISSIRQEGGLGALTVDEAETLIRNVEEILQLEDEVLGPPPPPG